MEKIKKIIKIDLYEKIIEDEKKIILRIIKNIILFIVVLIKKFREDKCILRASALVYTTLLAIIPLLAIGFSVIKGFASQLKYNEIIKKFLMPLGEQGEKLANKINYYVNNTDFSSIGIIGFIFLIMTIISTMSNIEKTFNEIWGVRKSRNILKKIPDYLSVTIIGPTLFIVSMSLIITNELKFLLPVIIIKILSIIPEFMPYLVIVFTMTFIYIYIPNTKVKLIPALLASIITGFIFIQNQIFYTYFTIISVRYNAIYGVFAQIPLFLIWLYLCWIIILLGAECAYVFQNFKSYTMKIGLKTKNLSFIEIEIISIIILNYLSEAFKNDKILYLSKITEKIKIPELIIKEVLIILKKLKYIILKEEEETQIVATRNLMTLKIKEIIEKLSKYKEDRENLLKEEVYNKFITYLKENSDKNLGELNISEIEKELIIN
ncbi:MAG TPA: YihY/virulence factor BrkB family protein [bacterium]|nr:YihY/virulence factor BrkB family protein [bacterium]HPQ18560.1 YihY/virulence factor BrkB family protein [bacterium]